MKKILPFLLALLLCASANAETAVIAPFAAETGEAQIAEAVAKAIGMKVMGLTGAKGGELGKAADIAVKVPETETYMIQELHLPIYHCWCLMLEERFFGEEKE